MIPFHEIPINKVLANSFILRNFEKVLKRWFFEQKKKKNPGRKTKHSGINPNHRTLDNVSLKFWAKNQVNWLILTGQSHPLKHNNLVLRYLLLKVTLYIYKQYESVNMQICVIY